MGKSIDIRLCPGCNCICYDSSNMKCAYRDRDFRGVDLVQKGEACHIQELSMFQIILKKELSILIYGLTDLGASN